MASGQARAHERQGLEPVHHRHGDVEEHEVGFVGGRRVDGLAPVLGVRHHLELAGALQRHREQVTQVGGVVDDEHPQRVGVELRLRSRVVTRLGGIGLSVDQRGGGAQWAVARGVRGRRRCSSVIILLAEAMLLSSASMPRLRSPRSRAIRATTMPWSTASLSSSARCSRSTWSLNSWGLALSPPKPPRRRPVVRRDDGADEVPDGQSRAPRLAHGQTLLEVDAGVGHQHVHEVGAVVDRAGQEDGGGRRAEGVRRQLAARRPAAARSRRRS